MQDCGKWELDIVDYVDGQLPKEKKIALEAHLQTCNQCAYRVQTMGFLLAETAQLEEELPQGLHEDIMDNVQAKAGKTKLRSIANWRKTMSVAVAAMFVVVCTAAVYNQLQKSKHLTVSDDVAALYGAEGAESSQQFRLENSADMELQEDEAADEGLIPGAEDAKKTSGAPQEEDAWKDENDTIEEYIFSAIAEDERYTSIIVIEAQVVPELLRGYSGDEAAADEALEPTLKENATIALRFVIVPAEECEALIRELDAAQIAYQLYNSESAVLSNIQADAQAALFAVYSSG